MAATVVAPVDAASFYDLVGIAPTPTALDATNGNKFLASSRFLVIVTNTDGSSHNVQFTSTADLEGRSADINQAIAAGVTRYFYMTAQGWADPTTGYVTMPSGQNANLKITIINLP